LSSNQGPIPMIRSVTDSREWLSMVINVELGLGQDYCPIALKLHYLNFIELLQHTQ